MVVMVRERGWMVRVVIYLRVRELGRRGELSWNEISPECRCEKELQEMLKR